MKFDGEGVIARAMKKLVYQSTWITCFPGPIQERRPDGMGVERDGPPMAANMAQNPHPAPDIGARGLGTLGVADEDSGEYFVRNTPNWSQGGITALEVTRSMHILALQAEELHACLGYLLFLVLCWS
jgi:hypothetical protein